MGIHQNIPYKKITLSAIFLCALIILLATQAGAQSAGQPWSRTYGGLLNDGFNKIINTSDGGYAAIGYTSTYGNGTGNQSSNVWLVKMSSNGTEQWNRTYGGTGQDVGYSIVQESDGGYAIAGYTTSYGYGNGSSNGTGNEALKMWLIRTDVNGNEMWNKTFGNGDQDGALDLAQTNDGGFILVGFSYLVNKTGWDMYLVKTDASGDLEWSKLYGGAKKDAGQYIEQTSDGGYIITGYTESYGLIHGDIYGDGSENLWLFKTDANGNEEWNNTYGGLDYNVGYYVQQLKSGDYIVAGTSESFDKNGTPITAFNETTDIARAYLLETNSTGAELWNTTFGGIAATIGFSMVVQPDGYVLAGTTGTEYGDDFFALKTSLNGTEEWNDSYGGPLNNYCYSIIPASNGGYALAGYTNSFGNGNTSGYVVKINSDGSGPAAVNIQNFQNSTNTTGSTFPTSVYLISVIVLICLIGALFFGWKWYTSK